MFKRGFSFAPGYRLEQFLGRGQFGQVWRATAPGGAAAAVKFIDLSGGEGAKEHQGVKRVKQIRHANLMPITAIWLLDQNGQAIEEPPEVGLETIDLGPVLASRPGGDESAGPATAGSSTASGNHDSVGGPATGFSETPARTDSPEVDAAWLAVGMLLGGLSLQHRLRECLKSGLPGIPPRELLSYMEESAKGLDFLNQPRHDLGDGPVAIQHCDVKPANIVLIGSSAVVCDFGLARILSRNQITATSASGTPAYMAPEAIAGRPSRTSDQYSLAVTYYHLRTGSLPVNDGTLWEVLNAHRTGQLDLSRVPEHEQAVLRRATSLKWEERFDSNQDLVDSLREALRLEGETRAIPMPSTNKMVEAPTAAMLAADPTLTLMPGQSVAEAQPQTAGRGVALAERPDRDAAASDAQAAETRNDRQWDRTLGGDAAHTPQPPSTRGEAGSAQPASPWWKQTKWRAAAAVPLVVIAGLVIQLTTSGPEELPVQVSNLDGSLKADSLGTDSLAETVTGVIDTATSSDAAGTPDQVRDTGQDLTAEQHFAAARTKQTTDYAAAVEHFRKAIELDPSLRELQPQLLTGHAGSGPVQQLLISRDGSQLVSVADDPSEFVWSLQKLSNPVPIQRSAKSGALIEAAELSRSPQQRLAAGGDELVVSDLSNPPLLRSWNLEDEYIVSLAWHPQGRYLVAATLTPSILLVDADAPQDADPSDALWRFETSQPIDSIAIDPAGRWLLILGEDGNVSRILWHEVEAIKQVAGAPIPQTFTSEGTAVRVMVPVANADSSTDGKITSALVTGGEDGEVTIWSLGEEPSPLIRQMHHSKQVEALAVTPRGLDGIIASAGGSGAIGLMSDGRTSNVTYLAGHEQLIASLDLSADGRWLTAGSYDGDITLWDLGDPDTPSSPGFRGRDAPMLRLRAEAGTVNCVRLDPTGRWIVAGHDDGLITLWDLSHAQLLIAVDPSSRTAPPRQFDPPKAEPDVQRGQAT